MGRENWKNAHYDIQSLRRAASRSKCASWNFFSKKPNFHRLEQGDLSLSKYMNKATILRDQCEYSRSPRQTTSSVLTLEDAKTIAQNQDATTHQVGYMRTECKSAAVQMQSTSSKLRMDIEP